ncbi:transmembrane adaptor Erv26-domain-containing protein [Mrakia frigida]|uniref:SVP26/TEX261 family protein n=1 Tax=Mrakia frigida TaxID=29902 RepID=UPI003FCC247F
MISLLHGVSYIAALAAFLFVTLSLASGLLWIAEVIEEHSKLAKVVGRRAIYAIIALHVAFFALDKFPILPIAFSIFCHVVYLQNFSKTWPLISLTSPSFLASCVLVLADHFVWFFHFSAKANEARSKRPSAGSPYSRPSYAHTLNNAPPAFMDVASFFGICVWFIPLYLFLSLSANDNALPSFGSAANPTTPSSSQVPPQPRQSIFLALSTRLLSLAPRLTRRSRNVSSMDDGLLAPRPKTRTLSNASEVYSPWGAPTDLPASPGVYTPGGSPWAGSPTGQASGGFQNELARRTSMGLTPPPPPRRSFSENNSYTVGSGALTHNPGGEGEVVGGSPQGMSRKASSSGLNNFPVRSPSPLRMNAGGGVEMLANMMNPPSGMAASMGRRREKAGGKDE